MATALMTGTLIGAIVTMSTYFGALFFLEGYAMVAVLLATVVLTGWWLIHHKKSGRNTWR
jgi:hypothetical protein